MSPAAFPFCLEWSDRKAHKVCTGRKQRGTDRGGIGVSMSRGKGAGACRNMEWNMHPGGGRRDPAGPALLLTHGLFTSSVYEFFPFSCCELTVRLSRFPARPCRVQLKYQMKGSIVPRYSSLRKVNMKHFCPLFPPSFQALS